MHDILSNLCGISKKRTISPVFCFLHKTTQENHHTPRAKKTIKKSARENESLDIVVYVLQILEICHGAEMKAPCSIQFCILTTGCYKLHISFKYSKTLESREVVKLTKFRPPQFSSLFPFSLGCAGCSKVLDPTLIPPGHVLFFLVLPSCHTNKSTVGTSANIKHNYEKNIYSHV